MSSPEQTVSVNDDLEYEPPDDSIICQSPSRRIDGHVFVSVPGPVPVVTLGREKPSRKR